MANAPQILLAAPARAGLRRWRVPVFFAAWTVLAAGVAWWLVASARSDHVQPQLLFDSGRAQIPVGEQIRQWLRIADLNFRGAYPWLLLAPYVFWLGSHFLLERGRLRVSLPVHVLACALFASASYALTTHVVEKMRVVMVLSDRRAGGPLPGQHADHGGITTVETTIADNSIRIHSFTSNVSGSTGRLITSSDGKVETFELPPPKGDADLTAGIGVANRFITNFPELAKSIANSADAEAMEGMGRRHASTTFSSMRSSWRYESRLFSNVLNVFAYGSLAGLAHAVHFYRRSRERERRAVLLESHLTKARLSALQAQLQPHFLFNALNAVATLLRRDARAAQEALTSFSELLRLALSQSDKPEVPLSEDLLFLERYVEIQQTRLGERFRFEQEVDPSTLNYLVPAVLLQPLVENALCHGIEQSSKPGLVRVVVNKQDRRLVLSVEDNGVGPGASGNPSGTGIGLSNLRARLEALYGADQKVELVARPEGGAAVRVEIPAREAGSVGSAGV